MFLNGFEELDGVVFDPGSEIDTGSEFILQSLVAVAVEETLGFGSVATVGFLSTVEGSYLLLEKNLVLLQAESLGSRISS